LLQELEKNNKPLIKDQRTSIDQLKELCKKDDTIVKAQATMIDQLQENLQLEEPEFVSELQRASIPQCVMVEDPGTFPGDREDFEKWYKCMVKHLGLYDDSFLILQLSRTTLHTIKNRLN
jgi:hypothetical protein